MQIVRSADLITTLLWQGRTCGEVGHNCFNSFLRYVKTVKTVKVSVGVRNTPLKWGVNEIQHLASPTFNPG
jgi:hypothetical protein